MNEGIIDKAEKGTASYSSEEELEQIKLAVASAKLAGNGFLTAENLNTELQKVFNNEEIVSESSNSFKYKNYKTYTINKDGSVGEYKSLLPANYKEIEYIESSGTQWIDTLFLPQKEMKYKFIADFQLTDFSKDRQTIMGNDTCDIRIDSNGYIFGNTNNPYIGLNRHSVSIEVLKLKNENFRFNFNCDGFEWNGEWSYWLDSRIAIFTNIAHIQQIPKVKVYSAKIWNNDSLIRDFIPCYSTTTVTDANGTQKPANTKGLYDTVEGKFYTNQGSGDDFIAGPNV